MNKDQIIEAIKAMSVLELNELVKACEEEFGVSAAAVWTTMTNTCWWDSADSLWARLLTSLEKKSQWL